MENMINIRCNWKHYSLEYQIKRRDTSQDMSKSAVLSRMIRAADKVEKGDWKLVKELLSKVEKLEEAPVFTNLQAKYDEESAEILERVKSKILLEIDGLKILQAQYLYQLLQVNYLEELKKESLGARADKQVKAEDVNMPEMVKLLVEMILLDKDSDALKKIKTILVDWSNK
ncbi:MAG TPA: hypothetical protein DC024_03320 [Clostridiales bacterium]|jgi:hypothetical protein|uniref:hypothetical protein n=1 Tax=Muricomes intestini TaxID=1796634 RepID=UPI000E8CA44F|nr:hypothetical protein [Clostridiales bacterium]HBI72859.1 hypothetical protein [Lachnospiraceae bacterium]